MNRQRLNKNIDELSKELLPQKAKKTGDYPVRFDHCFKRIAFDFATQGKWDEKVNRPFKDNASDQQLLLAYKALMEMYDDPELCNRLNEKSLSYR